VVEAQGYAVAALRGLADLAAHDDDLTAAAALRDRAERHAAGLERFWDAERGHYGLALDGDGRLSPVLASNQGHLLWATAIPAGRAERVRDAMMSPEMFSGWGIRTLASSESGYNPVGYHLGTVWPHDTAMIAMGLRKFGFDEDFTTVFQATLETAAASAAYRLPELFAGFSRTEFETPVPYPVACQPQAWAAGSIPYLMLGGLGLVPDGLRGRLRVRRPSLPGWLNHVRVRNLRIAGASVDLAFERTGSGAIALADVRVRGDVDVVLEIRGSRAPTGSAY
jgi:glycogen debranching enzyme